MYNDQNLDPKCKCRTINFIRKKLLHEKSRQRQKIYIYMHELFSQVNVGNKISPFFSANSRAVHVDRGEKTTVAKRMHAIRKAFILKYRFLTCFCSPIYPSYL